MSIFNLFLKCFTFHDTNPSILSSWYSIQAAIKASPINKQFHFGYFLPLICFIALSAEGHLSDDSDSSLLICFQFVLKDIDLFFLRLLSLILARPHQLPHAVQKGFLPMLLLPKSFLKPPFLQISIQVDCKTLNLI